jgi:hypothetical protein
MHRWWRPYGVLPVGPAAATTGDEETSMVALLGVLMVGPIAASSSDGNADGANGDGGPLGVLTVGPVAVTTSAGNADSADVDGGPLGGDAGA